MATKMILTGDVNLMSVTDPAVPFALVRDELRGAGIVFANLECCLHQPPEGHSVEREGFFADPVVAGEALKSAGIQAVGIANNVKVHIDWIDSEVFEAESEAVRQLEGVHGILVPGGFGERGSEGKIQAARFAREREVPYFGICFGMQMAVIEAARNLCGIEAANSTEFGATSEPVVGLMTEWMKGNELQKRGLQGDLGGTMRLGAYPAVLGRGSRVGEIYRASEISERHRHRYEVNTAYKDRLAQHGMRFSGISPDGLLPEIIEYDDHPWFIGVQFHPELKSRPFAPHPLFSSFIGAAVEQSRLV